METYEYHNKLFYTGVSTVLIVVFLIITAIAIIVFRGNSNSQPATSEQSTQQTNFQGSLSLVIQNAKPSYTVGDTVEVQVIANSGESEIVGYDADLMVGTGAQFVSATSLLSDFDVRTTNKNDTVIVTGFKKLSASGGSVLVGTPVASVTFKLNRAGSIAITPQLIPGQKTESNLIDTNNENVLTSAEGVEITVN